MDEKLIEAVRCFPCLWQTMSKAYKDLRKRLERGSVPGEKLAPIRTRGYKGCGRVDVAALACGHARICLAGLTREEY